MKKYIILKKIKQNKIKLISFIISFLNMNFLENYIKKINIVVSIYDSL